MHVYVFFKRAKERGEKKTAIKQSSSSNQCRKDDERKPLGRIAPEEKKNSDLSDHSHIYKYIQILRS